MDSAINTHLAITKLQDSLAAAQSARAAHAVARPARPRRLAWRRMRTTLHMPIARGQLGARRVDPA